MWITLAAWSALLAAACTFPDVDIDPDAACDSDDDCEGQVMPFCRDNRCVSCRADDDCAETSEGARCSPDGSCVSCVSEDDCASGACDVPTGACLECATDGDCEGQRCDEGICVECLGDGDCDGKCSDSRCVECAEDGDCDPPHCFEQQCVDCIPGQDDCGMGKACDPDLHACTPDHCSDGMPGAGETDEDCGADCPPCDVGGACAENGDCASNKCVDDVCQACTDSGDCLTEEEYCDGNHCLPRKPVGASCVEMADACVTDAVCVDGVCCESDCPGACQGCTEFVTGKPSGQCAQALEGTDCVSLSLLQGACNASGVCIPLGGLGL